MDTNQKEEAPILMRNKDVEHIVNAAANKIDHDFTILQFKFANKTLQEDYSLSLSPHRFSVVE